VGEKTGFGMSAVKETMLSIPKTFGIRPRIEVGRASTTVKRKEDWATAKMGPS
jgi:hypothetical protein